MKKADAEKLFEVLEYVAMLEKADFENALDVFYFDSVQLALSQALSNIDDLFEENSLASIYDELLKKD